MDIETPRFTFVAKEMLQSPVFKSQSARNWYSQRAAIIAVKEWRGSKGESSKRSRQRAR